MNYNKIIKDLKKENDSLKNQYLLMEIRAICSENKQERINKAIEYIEKHKYYSPDENNEIICGNDIEKLNNILKGEIR